MNKTGTLRERMVEQQISARGIRSPLVLKAMRAVAREQFVPEHLREFAYEDAPQPIEDGQTISQPYIVALMADAALLSGGEKVLEIGTGSGYAAAILARIAGEVYTIERISSLASKAAATLSSLGFSNVHVRHGDGTLGWPEQGPFDAIIVSASSPKIPETLKTQLKTGGRLIVPVGEDFRAQELLRVTRLDEDTYKTEDIADVRFVPLLGQEGWPEDNIRFVPTKRGALGRKSSAQILAQQAADCAEPFPSIETANLDAMLDRIGDARIVLLGEATHGTSEFYRMRSRISRELIERKGFSFVAIEGDWPDAARLDHYVRHFEHQPSEWVAFARFPQWMWRNREMAEFVDWLRARNVGVSPDDRVAVHGLDLYSLYNSIDAVLRYLDDVDPATAKIARERYGCLTPWQTDPATYGRAALSGNYRECETAVVHMLSDLVHKHGQYAEHDGERFLDAVQNARLVANAERYYRIMYYGSRASWNLRDDHMFDTLKILLAFHGPASKAIVWAHNSHLGDSAATEMAMRGEHNIGHLCREVFGSGCYAIGLGTGSGTVAAASDWDGPMEIKTVRPPIAESYERLFHETGIPSFSLDLRHKAWTNGKGLSEPRLQRAIGVIYRPESELASHYFQAHLPRQFDEFLWFDRSSAVEPLNAAALTGLPDTYPFGL
jgi:protein-L-isoaspartate(D-aspartate) O-methyltransferase